MFTICITLPYAECKLFQVPVGSPDEVDEIFDVISYSKGASVIRMLHNFIGDDVSRNFFLIWWNRVCPSCTENVTEMEKNAKEQ